MTPGRTLVAVALLSMATGCPDREPEVPAADARVPPADVEPAFRTCHPLMDQCDGAEKCTYVESNGREGKTICVAAGQIDDGGDCEINAATGEDDCRAGLWCRPMPVSLKGQCLQVCDLGPGAPVCATGSCERDDKAFADVADIGVCKPPA